MFAFFSNYPDNQLRERASEHKHKWQNLNEKKSSESLITDR